MSFTALFLVSLLALFNVVIFAHCLNEAVHLRWATLKLRAMDSTQVMAILVTAFYGWILVHQKHSIAADAEAKKDDDLPKEAEKEEDNNTLKRSKSQRQLNARAMGARIQSIVRNLFDINGDKTLEVRDVIASLVLFAFVLVLLVDVFFLLYDPTHTSDFIALVGAMMRPIMLFLTHACNQSNESSRSKGPSSQQQQQRHWFWDINGDGEFSLVDLCSNAIAVVYIACVSVIWWRAVVLLTVPYNELVEFLHSFVYVMGVLLLGNFFSRSLRLSELIFTAGSVVCVTILVRAVYLLAKSGFSIEMAVQLSDNMGPGLSQFVVSMLLIN